jgi:hypothetical protein
LLVEGLEVLQMLDIIPCRMNTYRRTTPVLKTNDFNSRVFRTYKKMDFNPRRMNTYKKPRGVGGGDSQFLGSHFQPLAPGLWMRFHAAVTLRLARMDSLKLARLNRSSSPRDSSA